MRRGALLLVWVCFASVAGQGAAHAAPDRLRIARTGTDAAIIKVPARNDTLAVGSQLRGAVYTWSRGDPPCDPTGSTVYAGHAWRAGNGVADRWGQLRRGDVIKVAGCRFEVTRREFWPAKRRMGCPLLRVGAGADRPGRLQGGRLLQAHRRVRPQGRTLEPGRGLGLLLSVRACLVGWRSCGRTARAILARPAARRAAPSMCRATSATGRSSQYWTHPSTPCSTSMSSTSAVTVASHRCPPRSATTSERDGQRHEDVDGDRVQRATWWTGRGRCGATRCHPRAVRRR